MWAKRWPMRGERATADGPTARGRQPILTNTGVAPEAEPIRSHKPGRWNLEAKGCTDLLAGGEDLIRLGNYDTAIEKFVKGSVFAARTIH